MTPLGTSRLTGGYNSFSDEGNRELYHQLMHNILESVNIVCNRDHCVRISFQKAYFHLER